MERCVDQCLEQPLLGSASQAVWLLVVDQPRPWKPKVQDGLQLDPRELAWLDEFRSTNRPFTLLARHSSEGRAQWFRWQKGRVERLDHPAGDAFAVEPTLLVCTHGSRDACCGSLGPRLAAGLAREHQVWEVSHLGGHRFAPTLWHLPSWRVYGRVQPGADWSDPRFLRGHAAYEPQIQVIEHHLWQVRGQWPYCIESLEGSHPLLPRVRVHWGSYDHGVEEWAVTLAVDKHRGPLSCRDIPEGKTEEYSSYRVVSSERLV